MKSSTRCLAALLLAPLAGPSCVVEQTGSEVEEAARTALRADSIHDWQALLRLAHPVAVSQYRNFQVEQLEPSKRRPQDSADSCMAVAVRHSQQQMLDSVFRAPTLEALMRIPAESVFARHRRWVGRSASETEEEFAEHRSSRRRLVGSTFADDSTAYVVVEETYENPPFPDWPERLPRIMRFQRYRGEWRSMLDLVYGTDVGNVVAVVGCK